jgi:two-component system sensor histidine kinase KdpD
MDKKRPTPEELLAQAQQEEGEQQQARKKGKLKVFLGYCAGVGKTYRMLQEAQTAHKSGISVAVGIAETHGRKETEALLPGLDIIPHKKVEYGGITLDEMDIDTILSRHPALALVDELAHTNAPGSRHEKRYQDVEELLNAGIDVYTTLNVQHIESLNDVVQQISGIRVAETVPDRIPGMADEVELVDLTPEKLIERLKEGKVYIPKKAEQAMRQFFKKGNLLALRELSLRYTARQVDEDVRGYMAKYAVSGPWPVGSRLMTGISSSPTSERLIRFTHRMAQDLDAEWYAVFVESPQQVEMNEAARLRLDKNIRLAEELRATVVLLKGTNVADEMLSFARSRNVTLVVVGPTGRSWIDRLLKGSVLNHLFRGGVSVLVADTRGTEARAEGRYPRRRFPAGAYALSFLAVALTTAAGILLRPHLDPLNIGMFLLLPAIASGIFGGMRVALFASLLSAAAFDFFFMPPYMTFRITDFRFLPAFAVFVAVALVTGYLAKSLRQEAEGSQHRERFVYSLYAFTKTLMAESDPEDILGRAVKNIYEAFECHAVVLLTDASGKLRIAARDRDDVRLTGTEEAVAAWVYGNGQAAGRSTKTLSASAWYFLPLRTQDRIIGAIGLKSPDKGRFLTPEQDQLLESFAGVVALAVVKAGIRARI